MGKRTELPDLEPGERELFPRRMRRLRMGLGLTQLEFAQRIGLSNKAVCDWEGGDTVPWSRDVPAIARALGVTTDYLLTGKEPPRVAALHAAIRQRAPYERLLAIVDNHDA